MIKINNYLNLGFLQLILTLANHPTFIIFFGLDVKSILVISQFSASASPLYFYLIAVIGKIAQFLFIQFKHNFQQIACKFMRATSLLLAKTRTTQSCIFQLFIILFSQRDDNNILYQSELSTTYIKPLVPQKQCDHKFLSFSCPPTSQTKKLIFQYLSYSTLNPIVGTVAVIQPSFKEYNIVVFPAPSSPNMSIFYCFFGIFLLKMFLKMFPMRINFLFSQQNMLHLIHYNEIYHLIIITLIQMTTYKEKYHLKKVQTLKTRPRIGYPQVNKPQLKAQKATTLKSLAIKNKTHNRERISNYTEDNIQDNNNKTTDNFYKHNKIQKNVGSQNQIPLRQNQMSKVKKFDLLNRNKSLNYWKRDSKNIDFNIISSVKTFINRIIRPNNGCNCEEPCIWALKMIKWVDVPQGLMHKHYNNLLQKTMKKDKNQEDIFQYYQQKWQAKQAQQRQKLFKQIKKDINRTQHESLTFQNQVFRQKLENILKCYIIQDPPIGYIQGMNMILSGILYHIKDQAKSYCVFRRILFLMRNIYQENFRECYFHVGQIKKLIQHQLADIYQLFEELGIQFQVICLPWILSLLTSIVPLDYLHLIYDGYIKQKWKFIYKVSLSIFIYHKQAIKQLNQAGQIMVLLSAGSQFHKQVNWQDLVQFANKLQIEQAY